MEHNKKYLLYGLLMLLLIGFGSALEGMGTFRQGDAINLCQVCSDASYITYSIKYPNSTIAIENDNLTAIGSGLFCKYFNFTDVKGRYDFIGKSDGCEKTFATYFTVTHLGKELSSASATMYLGFLALLVLVFFLNFFGMGFLPDGNTKDEEGRILSISYLKYFRNVLWMTGYFLFIAIMFVASNLAFGFMEEEFFANILFTIFRVSFGIAPLIITVWLVWIFVSMFHDKQFQKMLNRGIFPGRGV